MADDHGQHAGQKGDEHNLHNRRDLQELQGLDKQHIQPPGNENKNGADNLKIKQIQ